LALVFKLCGITLGFDEGILPLILPIGLGSYFLVLFVNVIGGGLTVFGILLISSFFC
jgi:hypothetical protein